MLLRYDIVVCYDANDNARKAEVIWNSPGFYHKLGLVYKPGIQVVIIEIEPRAFNQRYIMVLVWYTTKNIVIIGMKANILP